MPSISAQGRGRSLSVLDSAARTATNSVDLTDIRHSNAGLIVVINMTAVTATGSVTFKVQGLYQGVTWDILTSVAITAVTSNPVVLRIRPGLTAAANTVANDLVPETVRILATHANGVSMTYDVDVILAS
jgi:hypothetical protein